MTEIVPIPRDPQARLRCAVRLLTRAQEEQQEAVARFRQGLGELRDSARGLRESVEGLRQQLRVTGEQVAAARDAALRLQATANRM